MGCPRRGCPSKLVTVRPYECADQVLDLAGELTLKHPRDLFRRHRHAQHVLPRRITGRDTNRGGGLGRQLLHPDVPLRTVDLRYM